MNLLLLSFIPTEYITYAIHGIFGIGVLGFIIGTIGSKIPFISTYGHIVKGIASLFLVAGIFFEGYHFASKDWLEQTKKFEDKVKVAEKEAKDANDKLGKAIKEKNKAIDEKAKLLQERLHQSAQKIDAECKVAPEAIQILNDALKTK